MFSHIFIGVRDFDRAFAFYEPVASQLGLHLRGVDRERPWAVWETQNGGRPFLIVGHPFEGMASAGNGQMTAFLAATRTIVTEAYRTALALGGSCEGPPGLRAHYHAHYFGGYVRDPDGNKLCFCCHEPT